MTKITEREIYNAILDETIDRDLLVEFATKKLTQLDHRNEKAKERAAKKRAEGDELTEKVFALVSADPQSREDITNALIAAGEDVTVGKVGYRLSALVADGRIVKEEAVLPGGDGEKTKRVMVYSIA